MKKKKLKVDPARFEYDCSWLWRAGYDTQQIAKFMRVKEHQVYNILSRIKRRAIHSDGGIAQ